MGTEELPKNDRITELWAKAQRAGLTRRTFLVLLTAGGATAVLAACAKATTSLLPSTSGTVSPATPTKPVTTSASPVTSSTVPSSTTTTKPAATTTQPAVPAPVNNKAFPGSIVLGRPTAEGITISLLASNNMDIYVEYGMAAATNRRNSGILPLKKDQPLEVEVTGITADTAYYYRVCHRVAGETDFSGGTPSAFQTQRAPGSTFSFGVQGDTHPERTTSMFNADLYMLTLNTVKSYKPDFYVLMGDDFSVDTADVQNSLNIQTVDKIYLQHRNWLGTTIADSVPLFSVNGNHEQIAQYLLDGTPNNLAVYSGKSRVKYFPQPAPNSFYGGNAKADPYIGLVRDSYSWTWGDALFVVIDFYWHSKPPVDNVFGQRGGKWENWWDFTLDATQYQWFKQTLESSKAKYKFVFTHQVLGTGRGGRELAPYYEWGGLTKESIPGFEQNRPGWAMPIHQLMVKNNVTIFFHGHDHLYCRQELDGVVYQECPIPADYTYTAFNSDAYKSGVTLPNSGFLNVTVSPAEVKVDYINSFLPKDETAAKKNGKIAYSYTIK